MAKGNALTVSLEPSPQAQQGVSLLAKAQTLMVVDKPSHTAALEEIKGAKLLKRSIEEHYAKIKRPINDSRNTVLQMEKDHLAPIDQAIRTIEAALTGYVREQERRERAEADRLRREAETAEEKRRQEEIARIKAEGLTRAETRAAVAAVKAAPVLVDVPEVETQIGKVSGTSMRTYYGCDVVNLRALVAAAATDDRLLVALMPNMVYLNEQARSLKENFSRVFPMCQLTKRDGVTG